MVAMAYQVILRASQSLMPVVVVEHTGWAQQLTVPVEPVVAVAHQATRRFRIEEPRTAERRRVVAGGCGSWASNVKYSIS